MLLHVFTANILKVFYEILNDRIIKNFTDSLKLKAMMIVR